MWRMLSGSIFDQLNYNIAEEIKNIFPPLKVCIYISSVDICTDKMHFETGMFEESCYGSDYRRMSRMRYRVGPFRFKRYIVWSHGDFRSR